MLAFLLSLTPGALVASGFLFLTAVFALRKAVMDYKVRKRGGVRAYLLASNPLTGNQHFTGPSKQI